MFKKISALLLAILLLLPFSTPARASTNDPESLIPLTFAPFQMVLNPSKPIVYLTDDTNNKVYAINYETKETASISFDLKPKRMFFYNNELFVTLMSGEYSHWSDTPPGQVGIINAENFTLEETFPVDTTPYDVLVDHEGYIYVSPGSHQWGYLYSYSRDSKTLIDKLPNVYEESKISLNPIENKIYIPDPDTQIVTVSQGKFINVTRPSIRYGNNLIFSPDNKFSFAAENMISDLNLSTQVASLDKSFTDAAFDLTNQLFYTVWSDKTITVYSYNNLSSNSQLNFLGTILTQGVISDIECRDGKIIGVSKSDDGKYSLEVIQTNSNHPLAVSNVYPFDYIATGLPINLKVAIFFNDYVIKDSNFNSIAFVDSLGNKIKANLEISDNLLVVSPQADLSYNAGYKLVLPPNSVKNLSNESLNLSSDTTFFFKTGNEYTRFGGIDRYDTNTQVSKQWTSAQYVVLTTGTDFPDALSAAPLAKKYEAPILLTNPKALPDKVESEINRLNPHTVFIIGGTGAVSQPIEDQLKAEGRECIRLQGKDRYETSIAVANYLGPKQTIFVVSGDGFADALSIAPYAASMDLPIILTEKDKLPDSALTYIKNNQVTKGYLIGGTGVISDEIYGGFPFFERISGQNRYETNYNVLAKFSADFSATFFANGENFPDALSGSSLAALGGHPIVLISNDAPPEFIDALSSNKSIMKMKYILGGTGVVSQSLLDRVFK